MRMHPLALAASLLATLAAAQAQTTSTPAATAALPEVKVTDGADSGATEGTGQYTAREVSVGKLQQAPRETPQSLSVVTRQQLDDRNLTRVDEVMKQTTGISINRLDGAGNFNTFLSRGFELGSIQHDGVPIPQGNYGTLDTAMYDRIEVLRGPAGLLQGASEPGGTVNLVRKRAPAQQTLGADAAVGSFGLRRGVVDVGGSLQAEGTVRARAVAVVEDKDSYVDTLFNHKRLGYGTLEWDLAPATTLSVGAAQQRVRATVDQGLPTYADGRLADLPRGAFAGLRSNRQDLDTTDVFAELEHRLDGGGLVRLSARDIDRTQFYRSARANSALSANGSFTMETVDGDFRVRTRNYDLFLATPVQAAGRTHKLLVGASYNEGRSWDGNFAYGASRPFNLLQPQYDQPYPAITLPGFSSIVTKREKALYGQAQLRLTDTVKLLAGGRLAWAEAVTRRTSDGAATSTAEPGRQFVPSAALMWDFHPQYTAYASYAETFVVQSQLTAAKQLLDPRTGKQVELGVKGEFLQKRLQAHAALFRIIDENRAIADPAVTNASIAGGKVRAQGFEAEVTGQPQAGWDVTAGYAYNDTRYLKAPVAQQGQVFSPITPRHSVNLFTRYAFTHPALRGFSVGGGMSYRSEFFAQSGALRINAPGYAVFNAQVGYQINDHLSVNLSVDNLLDKTYYEKVSGVSRQNYYGEPRRVTLALKARY